MNIKKLKIEKAISYFSNDYINNSLAKSEVPNMYIVGGVGSGK